MKSNTAVICLSPYSGGMELDAIKLAQKLSNHAQIILIAKQDYFIEKQAYSLENSKIKLETIKFCSSFSFAIIFKMRKILNQHNIKNVIFFGASEMKSLYFAFLGFDINLIIRHGTTKSTPKKDFFIS